MVRLAWRDLNFEVESIAKDCSYLAFANLGNANTLIEMIGD
jgi:hypothetical protein